MTGAFTRYLENKLTPETDQEMQIFIAGLSSELATLVNPTGQGRWRAENFEQLAPKPGQSLKTNLLSLASYAQTADNALETAGEFSPFTPNQLKYLAWMRQQIKHAIFWTPDDVLDFAQRGGPQSFADFLKAKGVVQPPITLPTPQGATDPAGGRPDVPILTPQQYQQGIKDGTLKSGTQFKTPDGRTGVVP